MSKIKIFIQENNDEKKQLYKSVSCKILDIMDDASLTRRDKISLLFIMLTALKTIEGVNSICVQNKDGTVWGMRDGL